MEGQGSGEAPGWWEVRNRAVLCGSDSSAHRDVTEPRSPSLLLLGGRLPSSPATRQPLHSDLHAVFYAINSAP